MAGTQPDHLLPADVPIESLRLRFALLQSLNTTLETFFLPLVELRQTPMYTHSIAALLKEAKGQCWAALRAGEQKDLPFFCQAAASLREAN